MGSPRPTIPTLVWIFRNLHRGFTRNVSSLVILSFSFGVIGALLPFDWANASAGANALRPVPAKMLATTDRRLGFSLIKVLLKGNHFIRLSVDGETCG